MSSKLVAFAVVGSLFIAACAAPADAPQDVPVGSEEDLAKRSCKLFVEEPSIHYVRSDGLVLNNPSNQVNSGVLALLVQDGFTLADRPETATLTMQTEVKCGPVQSWVWFTPVTQDACQTEVRFVKRATNQVLKRSTTVATPGLNIDFNGITWPQCKEL
jgi:hypothetical protein